MRTLLLLSSLMVVTQAIAHGDDKLGPNGGFITMPGAFHVEAVPVNSTQLKVYLLDINWEKPMVKDSSVEVMKGTDIAKCTSKTDHFVCDFSKSVDLTKVGELTVKATRAKQLGNVANYSTPLQMKKK